MLLSPSAILPLSRTALFLARASSKADNFGIGLILSKSIIVGHGGEIWAESVHGVGTSIHFTLRKRKFRTSPLSG